MRLLVVGAGAMGRWFARSVDADVAFTDLDVAAAQEAAGAVDADAIDPGVFDSDAGDRGGSDAEAGRQFDAVCFAVPISSVTTAIEQYAGYASRAVLDVSGVMAGPLETMREHGPDCERVSLHPLFAPENAPGNVAVVADERGQTVESLLADLRARDNHLFETTAAEHDEAMETVQARVHTAVLAFGLAAEDVSEEFHTPISAALTELVEAVAGGNPRVYREIQQSFDGAADVASAADRLATAAERAAGDDGELFDRLYREAGEMGMESVPSARGAETDRGDR
jgi:prephenate dehydrogenase